MIWELAVQEEVYVQNGRPYTSWSGTVNFQTMYLWAPKLQQLLHAES